jgi:hypothetical protein
MKRRQSSNETTIKNYKPNERKTTFRQTLSPLLFFTSKQQQQLQIFCSITIFFSSETHKNEYFKQSLPQTVKPPNFLH